MRQMQSGYRGLSVFLGLNADRFLSAFAILVGVLLAAWIQSI